jgi:hypothetical protein
MYPLTCIAGFNVPARKGCFKIVGFTVAVNDMALDSEFTVIDDIHINQSLTNEAGYIHASMVPPIEEKKIIASVKGKASTVGVLEWFPPEPVKTRYGTSLCFTNIRQGSVCLYVQ